MIKCNDLWKWRAGACLRAWFWPKLRCCESGVTLRRETTEKGGGKQHTEQAGHAGLPPGLLGKVQVLCRVGSWSWSPLCKWFMMGFTATAPVPGEKDLWKALQWPSWEPRLRLTGRKGAGAWTPLWSLLPPWKGQRKPPTSHWQGQSLSHTGNRCAEGAFDFVRPTGDVLTDSREERIYSGANSVILNQARCSAKSRKVYSNEDYCDWAQPFLTTLLHLVVPPDALFCFTWSMPITKVGLYSIFRYNLTVKLYIYKIIHIYSQIKYMCVHIVYK